MIERNGSIWETDAKIIGHGVNTKGLMGAGIAVQFRERFPKNYEAYRDECSDEGLKPGSICGMVEDGKVLLNFASQDKPGKNARYDWLFNSLYTGAELVASNSEGFIDKFGSVIAIPEIGCGIGGLKWRAVARIILAVEAAVDNKIEFEVWHYVS